MKKSILLIVLSLLMIQPIFADELDFSYTGNFEEEKFPSCSKSSVKTYMDYRAITDPTSPQYPFIQENMNVDEQTGLLYDQYGFIGVALGSWYGEIGERYIFELKTGVRLPLIKIEEKDDDDCISGCYQKYDKSVIEFVVNSDYAENYFGRSINGYILQGNFNNYEKFSGEINKVYKVIEKENSIKIDFSPIQQEKEKISFNFIEIH